MTTKRALLGLVYGLVMLALGLAWLRARQEAGLLRFELEQRTATVAEWEQLQRENARLRAAQPSPELLKNLRADRAAVVRLRAEVETLKTGRALPPGK